MFRDPRLAERLGRRLVRAVVERGQERLAETLRPRPGGVFLSVAEAAPGKASTGNYRRNVSTAMRGSVGVIDDGGVVYGPWLEGTGSRNGTTRFKGYASFRRTADWLNKHMTQIVRPVLANWTRGMA